MVTIGSATFAYAQLINPVIEAETADHVEVVRVPQTICTIGHKTQEAIE